MRNEYIMHLDTLTSFEAQTYINDILETADFWTKGNFIENGHEKGVYVSFDYGEDLRILNTDANSYCHVRPKAVLKPNCDLHKGDKIVFIDPSSDKTYAFTCLGSGDDGRKIALSDRAYYPEKCRQSEAFKKVSEIEAWLNAMDVQIVRDEREIVSPAARDRDVPEQEGESCEIGK